MKLGDNIQKLRKDLKLSQEQLAEKIDVTRQTISNWELGETSPNPEQLKLLSKALNVSIDELLNNDVKSVIIDKVSNTEKLAGIIIKISNNLQSYLNWFIYLQRVKKQQDKWEKSSRIMRHLLLDESQNLPVNTELVNHTIVDC